MSTEFRIMSSTAPSRGGYNGYRRIALVECYEGVTPKMISPRAIGMVRIIQTWENLYVGTTEDCAYSRAMKEAEGWLARLTVR